MILFLFWYFLLEMVPVMNEPHYHKKNVAHVWQIFSQMTVIWHNHKVINIEIILYRSSCSQILYKIGGVHKGVLKNLTNICIGYNVNVKVWLYAFRLYLYYERDACKQFFSSRLCRIFKKDFLLEHTWTNASDFMLDIFKSKK